MESDVKKQSFHVNTYEVLAIGNEQTCAIVIDDFAKDVVSIRDEACRIPDYAEDGKTGYPGVRTPLPGAYVKTVMEAITPLLYEQYAIPSTLSPNVELAYYSLLTTPARKLNPLQRLPHFDTNNTHYYAVLHYLNEGDFGGTGFFRHRPTGFERVTRARSDIYKQSASAFMAVRGLPEEKYINSSTNHYELITGVAYKANRLVIYPGNLLHSGLVSEAVDVCSDPARGRLTANIFIDFH